MDIVFYFFSYNAIMVFLPPIETQNIVNVHDFYLKNILQTRDVVGICAVSSLDWNGSADSIFAID